MESGDPFANPSATLPLTSRPQTSTRRNRTRDALIHEYVNKARERTSSDHPRSTSSPQSSRSARQRGPSSSSAGGGLYSAPSTVSYTPEIPSQQPRGESPDTQQSQPQVPKRTRPAVRFQPDIKELPPSQQETPHNPPPAPLQGLGLSNLVPVPPVPPTPRRTDTKLERHRQRAIPRQTITPSSGLAPSTSASSTPTFLPTSPPISAVSQIPPAAIPAQSHRPYKHPEKPPIPPYSSGRSRYGQPRETQAWTPMSNPSSRQPHRPPPHQPMAAYSPYVPPESRFQRRPVMGQVGPQAYGPSHGRPIEQMSQPRADPNFGRPFAGKSVYAPPPISSMQDRGQPMEMTATSAALPSIIAAPRIVSLQAEHTPASLDIEEQSEGRNSMKPSLSSVLLGTDVLSEYYETSDDDRPASKLAPSDSANSLRPEQSMVRQVSVGQRQMPTLLDIPGSRSESSTDKTQHTMDTLVAVDDSSTSDLKDIDMLDKDMLVPHLTPRSPLTPHVEPAATFPRLSRNSSFAASSPTVAGRQSLESFKSAKALQSPVLGGSKTLLTPVESRFRQIAEEPLDRSVDPEPGFTKRPEPLIEEKTTLDTQSANLTPELGTSREGGVRASTTSLPGLITRALRLASNLERGKTSSKFGLDWMTPIAESQPQQTPEPQPVKDVKHKSEASLSAMIDAFPGTPAASPRPDRGQLPLSEWPRSVALQSALRRSHHAMSSLPSSADLSSPKRNRRCCFMPVWLFVTVILGLILIIVAAIIIPLALVVIPNESRANSVSVSSCQSNLPCSNNGTSAVSASGVCQCMCAEGWAGAQCTVQDTGGCMSIMAGGSNYSIGSAIPRLVTLSQTTLRVVLNETMLLGTFSSADLSCASQNALVTFNGLSSRAVADVQRLPHRARQVPQTLNSIIYASSTSISNQSSTTSTAASASATATPFSPSSQSSLDFGRVVVLYVLQTTSNLTTAITSQSDLQAFFIAPDGLDPSSLSIGDGWTADFYTASLTESGK